MSRIIILNDTNKKGRPRTFNIDDALLAAMSTFWLKGYDGTSMKDLTKAMGISGPSLYAAFGDKRELYLKTIDRYADVNSCAPIVAFEAEKDIAQAVKGFLTSVIIHSTADKDGPRGCFLASCVSTSVGEIEGVEERMIKAIEDTDIRLAKRFNLEKEKGNLRQNFPSLARARLLYDMRQGYVFRGRAGWSAESLMIDIEDRVDMVIS